MFEPPKSQWTDQVYQVYSPHLHQTLRGISVVLGPKGSRLDVAYSGIHPSRQLVHAAGVAGKNFEPDSKLSKVRQQDLISAGCPQFRFLPVLATQLLNFHELPMFAG